ncbi:MAG: putative protein N(5)-glutamine methyltransferase [Paenibacillus sp.]|nr:putative protein N(5)-glutamine methyltransferase [Paenibacillus sp.]
MDLDKAALRAEVGSFVNRGDFHADTLYSITVSRLREAGCVFAEEETRLLVSAARTPADLAAMADRRAAGVPLEHVIGWAEFCGLRIAVDKGVFVPRHRTEFLIRQAAALARSGAVVVDLCCGSGALGAALAAVPSQPPAVTYTKATFTSRCPPHCEAASTFWSPMHPTYPPRRLGCCPRRPAYMRREWRSTEERTGLTSSVE